MHTYIILTYSAITMYPRLLSWTLVHTFRFYVVFFLSSFHLAEKVVEHIQFGETEWCSVPLSFRLIFRAMTLQAIQLVQFRSFYKYFIWSTVSSDRGPHIVQFSVHFWEFFINLFSEKNQKALLKLRRQPIASVYCLAATLNRAFNV